MIVHLTAHLQYSSHRLDYHPLASWLWDRLRLAFPTTLAATLMPNHLHLLSIVDSPVTARHRLASVLSGYSRRRWPFGADGAWHRVPDAEIIPDHHQLRRQVRYVGLNPSRARLAADPLSWLWTTLRDFVGAAVEPWVCPVTLAQALGRRCQGFVAAHHRYVSADPSTDVVGSPLPQPVNAQQMATKSLEDFGFAAVAATRSTYADIKRRSPARNLFLALVRQQKWFDSRQIAEFCGMTRQGIVKHESLGSMSKPELAAGLLCLGDPRLTAYLREYANAA